VATALATRFREASQCFQRAREAFSHLGLRDFHHERPFGGRANIVLRRPLQRGDQLWVGEAAGLQDYLLGFGLRYAILSGQLAARALITGERYPRLVRRHIRPGFRAAIANRWLYNLAGDRGRGLLIRWVAQADDVTSLARRVYALTPVHRAVYPFAWLAAPKEP
jgi:flavin-dependent dehydrogenase